MAKTGIVGFGVYVPKYRIRVEEIARVWGDDAEGIKKGLLIHEKAVAGPDEDTATIAVQACLNALREFSHINPKDIGAIYVGSESHPYAVKPTATIVAEAIGATPNLTAADLEFACKAGTAGLQIIYNTVSSGWIDLGVSIGADTAQGRPGDALEYSAASGGAAFFVGKKHVIAEILHTCSYTTDTPDFWRREGEKYPRHGARFTGEPAYFKHIISATKLLIEETEYSLRDIDYFVFHQPNGKFPLKAAKMLGIPKEKVLPGLVVTHIGNTYSGSSLIGLAKVLTEAQSGALILLTSFGSGAGSDSFLIKMKTPVHIEFQKYVGNPVYIDYATYAKFREKLVM
jgi:hydroxymethylglutaryl-CoA synthase